MEKFIKTFTDIINEYAEVSDEIKLLPLCHTTTEGFLISIINSQCLRSRKPCRIYNEYLVYFFYGKSSYLVDQEAESYTQDPPITLIYEADKLSNYQIKRILPFDSGGYERYKMRNGFEKENYTHESAELRMLKGMIKLIYETNDNYLENQVSYNELSKHVDTCREIKEILEFYKKIDEGELNAGQQVHSIELQFESKEKKLEIEPTYIILPYNFFTTKYWGENFKKQFPNIAIDHYGQEEIIKRPGKALSGSDYMRLMKQKVLNVVK